MNTYQLETRKYNTQAAKISVGSNIIGIRCPFRTGTACNCSYLTVIIGYSSERPPTDNIIRRDGECPIIVHYYSPLYDMLEMTKLEASRRMIRSLEEYDARNQILLTFYSSISFYPIFSPFLFESVHLSQLRSIGFPCNELVYHHDSIPPIPDPIYSLCREVLFVGQMRGSQKDFISTVIVAHNMINDISRILYEMSPFLYQKIGILDATPFTIVNDDGTKSTRGCGRITVIAENPGQINHLIQLLNKRVLFDSHGWISLYTERATEITTSYLNAVKSMPLHIRHRHYKNTPTALFTIERTINK